MRSVNAPGDHEQVDGAKEQRQDEGQQHRAGEMLVVHLVVLAGEKTDHNNYYLTSVTLADYCVKNIT